MAHAISTWRYGSSAVWLFILLGESHQAVRLVSQAIVDAVFDCQQYKFLNLINDNPSSELRVLRNRDSSISLDSHILCTTHYQM